MEFICLAASVIFSSLQKKQFGPHNKLIKKQKIKLSYRNHQPPNNVTSLSSDLSRCSTKAAVMEMQLISHSALSLYPENNPNTRSHQLPKQPGFQWGKYLVCSARSSIPVPFLWGWYLTSAHSFVWGLCMPVFKELHIADLEGLCLLRPLSHQSTRIL